MDDGLFPTPSAPAAYRVLARKYRPSSFSDLIGQEPMVRTLENAFRLERIHQAYLLTGVRGVGKTTTARILARAFNYELPEKDGRPAVSRPTIEMDELGVHCQAIMESRHPDVLEMDAASHTSIDDVREIIDNARYRPVMARMKVYIIDEVHMLSKSAFNGLLKTLEEPPEHVKFLFATTEIEKVPVTVRSRCQRFDLRRVDAALLAEHLRKICALENVKIEPAALAVIARAAEGSVRDALSLLDQAMAHGAAGEGAEILAEDLRAMLGVADRASVIELFEAVMAGRIADALKLFEDQYNAGADPAQMLIELAEFTHLVTRIKVAPQTAQSSALTPEESRRGTALSGELSLPALSRAWQILAKGMEELRSSQTPYAAADMVLVRLAHAAELPTPDEALRKLGFGAGAGPTAAAEARPGARGAPVSLAASSAASPAQSAPNTPRRAGAAAAPQSAPAPSGGPALRDFPALVALAAEKRDMLLKLQLEQYVRLVRFEPLRLEFALAPGAPPQLPQILTQRLQSWTGERWLVSTVAAGGKPTLDEERDARETERRSDIARDPVVAAALACFPGAQIVAVRGKAEEATPVASEAEIAYADGAEPDED